MKLRLFIAIILVVLFLLTGNSFAATYYVATTGNDASPGTESEPWRTLRYAAKHISNGDTVLVRGGTYTEWFIINVPNVTFQNYPNEIPIIDGEWTLPVAPNTPRCYDALLGVNAEGITIDGFEVKNSTGVGIKVWGSGTDNVTIRNCKSHDTYYTTLQLSHYIDNVLIEDCEFYRGGKVWYLHHDRATWGDPANVTTPTITNCVFSRCIIRDSYNEGILLARYSSNITVEYCQIYGNRKLQIYICNSTDQTIRYNLIYGTNPNDNGEYGKGSGVYFSNETQWNQPDVYSNSKVYGNLIANTSTNLWIAGATTRKVHNVIAYNNTIVEAGSYAFKIESTTGRGHIFKNNIVLQTNGTIAYIPSGKVTGDYNLWSREPDVDVQGANDPTYSDPQLAKTIGWNTLGGGDLTGQEFALQNASTAIDAGTHLIPTYSKIPDCNVSIWSAAIKLRNQNDQGSGWEIGADIHVVDTPPNVEIKSPTLKIKTSSK